MENEMGGQVARMGERSGKYRALVRNLRERDHLEDLCIDEKNKRIILK
jgi:hypothetical protein